MYYVVRIREEDCSACGLWQFDTIEDAVEFISAEVEDDNTEGIEEDLTYGEYESGEYVYQMLMLDN